jgi:hypothetical protein
LHPAREPYVVFGAKLVRLLRRRAIVEKMVVPGSGVEEASEAGCRRRSVVGAVKRVAKRRVASRG